jgi:glycosyltransferase
LPTISIITATFNAASTVGDCLQSVASQTHPCEHIIIDSASTDSTLEIVRRIASTSRILSEPDKGIYDAMNKGIALATGEVIGILNADDFYASPLVMDKVARLFDDPAVMSCYGDLEYVRERETGNVKSEKNCPSPFTVTRYWKSGSFTPDKFYWGWMPPHPTFFVRRSVYERYGLFNLELGSAADYEMMLRLLLKERITTVYIPEVLVRMRVGGASNRSLAARLAANCMDRRAWKVNGLRPHPWTVVMKPLRKVLQWVQKSGE